MPAISKCSEEDPAGESSPAAVESRASQDRSDTCYMNWCLQKGTGSHGTQEVAPALFGFLGSRTLIKVQRNLSVRIHTGSTTTAHARQGPERGKSVGEPAPPYSPQTQLPARQMCTEAAIAL